MKWLILIIPPMAIGLWEYVRHAVLLPYLSMETGNILAPFIVLAVTIFPLLLILSHMKKIEEELHEEKALKSILCEREQMAGELHDGIAQSLFLLSVKVNKLKKSISTEDADKLADIMRALESVNTEVRKSIISLRQPTKFNSPTLSASFGELVRLTREHHAELEMDWGLQEEEFSPAEKMTLYAIIREAIINAIKHSSCQQITIFGHRIGHSKKVIISDDGTGIDHLSTADIPIQSQGLAMMKERAHQIRWDIQIISNDKGTRIILTKEEK